MADLRDPSEPGELNDPDILRRLYPDIEVDDGDPDWDDDAADDEDLFGFQGWTRGGTPIQEF